MVGERWKSCLGGYNLKGTRLQPRFGSLFTAILLPSLQESNFFTSSLRYGIVLKAVAREWRASSSMPLQESILSYSKEPALALGPCMSLRAVLLAEPLMGFANMTGIPQIPKK